MAQSVQGDVRGLRLKDGFKFGAAGLHLVGRSGAGQSERLHRRYDPFFPCVRKGPSEARSDEGFAGGYDEWCKDPSSAPSGHILPQGEKDW